MNYLRSYLGAFVLVSAASLIGFGTAAGSEGEDPATNVELNDQVARDQALREDLGFQSARSYVLNLYENRNLVAKGSREEYGALFTPQEAESIEKSKDLSEANDVIYNFVRARGLRHLFAGIVITDHDSGGIANVGFTQEGSEHFQRLKERYPYPERLNLFSARYSEEELNDLTLRISNDIPSLRSQGIEIRTVGTSVSDNIVEVGDSEASDGTRDVLTKRYGERIRVVESPQVVRTSYDYHYPPMVGGTRIFADTTGNFCSTGWGIKNVDNANTFVLTSGHCFYNPTSKTGWNHGRCCVTLIQPIGAYHSDSYFTNSKCDCGFVSLFVISDASAKLHLESEIIRTMTSVQSPGNDAVGDFVCKSGHTSEVSCGTINRRLATISNPDGRTFINQREASYFSNKGDSGGSVFTDWKIKGITVSKTLNDQYSYYSHIGTMEEYFPNRRAITN